MQEFLALEVWILAVAAPCILAWILGEVHGAARVRGFMEHRQLTVEEAVNLQGLPASLTLPNQGSFSVPSFGSALRPGRSRTQVTAQGSGPSASGINSAIDSAFEPDALTGAIPHVSTSNELSGVPQSSQSYPSGCERSALFAEMPSPEQRREEADWRRREMEALRTECPSKLGSEAAEALSAYRASVGELVQSNTHQDMRDALAAFAPPIDEPRPRARTFRDGAEERYKTALPEALVVPNPQRAA